MTWKCENCPGANPIAHGAEHSHRQKIRPVSLRESRTSARTSVPVVSSNIGTEPTQSHRRNGHIFGRLEHGSPDRRRTITFVRSGRPKIYRTPLTFFRGEMKRAPSA